MNNFSSVRNRRSLLDFSGFTPIQFPISNYSTSAQTKTEMKHTFEESILINNLHLIPDPLKKNLADSVITGEDKKTDMGNTKEFITRGPERPHQRDYYLSLAGITSFFSGVFNVMGAMFQKRSTSPVPQYYDCYENDYDEHQMASNPWHSSKYEVQNKNERAQVSNESNKKLDVEMNADCRIAASNCEDKINQVRLLLENKNHKNVPITRFKPRRPKMAFIEADSVENMFEEAIPPEDILLPNETILEYYCPYSYQDGELYETDSPKVKTEIINESLDIIQNLPTTSLPIENENKTDLNENIDITIDTLEDENIEKPIETARIVSSCEEKLNKLKALLKTCHNKNKDLPINNVDVSKPMDIPNSNTKINKDIETETIFYNDINSSDLKKNNCFNEVTGKFYSSSIESEDSFQIVFSDSPQNFECTRRLPSDCESEDSFIMFEETPDSCYTNNDVFGDDTYQDSSDSDSDIEDSGCITKLSPNLSRTFGDLTDNSLYSEDVVDYSVNLCDHANESKQMSTGLLLNEKRKLEKKNQPTKKVHFSTQPPKVHVMRVWAFAARQARAGHWERHALDRERFKRRIADVEMAVSWVLKPQHRSRIVFQRFMPWWNAEKRRELAEKKLKEDEERNESVNSVEVSVSIDRCDDINKKKEESDNINKSNDDAIYSRKKEINCHIGTIVDKTKKLDLVGNNFVDENEKISDNDQLEVSVKNKINGIITNEYVLENINITNPDT